MDADRTSPVVNTVVMTAAAPTYGPADGAHWWPRRCSEPRPTSRWSGGDLPASTAPARGGGSTWRRTPCRGPARDGGAARPAPPGAAGRPLRLRRPPRHQLDPGRLGLRPPGRHCRAGRPRGAGPSGSQVARKGTRALWSYQPTGDTESPRARPCEGGEHSVRTQPRGPARDRDRAPAPGQAVASLARGCTLRASGPGAVLLAPGQRSSAGPEAATAARRSDNTGQPRTSQTGRRLPGVRTRGPRQAGGSVGRVITSSPSSSRSPVSTKPSER